MRGNIIMWNGEKGIVAASGQRYDFDIHTWKGDVAPKPDMSVMLTLNEGTLLGLAPLADAELAKEKFNQLGDEGSKIAKGILSEVGLDIAVAYAAFALSALFLNVLTGTGYFVSFTAKMAAVLNGMPVDKDVGFSNGGLGLCLVLISVVSIVVPYFWRSKFAPLAFCVPLLIALLADVQAFHIVSIYKQMLQGYNQMFGGVGNPFNFGLGLYLSTAIAAYLAFRGYVRFKRQAV